MHLLKLIIAHASQWLAYNNIRASLVLILVSTMGFSDLNAFTAYSTMIVLGDINSLAGAYFGDKITGHHFTWLFGAGLTFIAYMMSGSSFILQKEEILITLNLIACGIGMSRCNGSSLIYSTINAEIPKEKQNSYISVLYTILIIATFIAYSASGIINQKFGVNGCFLFSGIIGAFSITLFTYTEFNKIKTITQPVKKFFQMSLCAIGIAVLGVITFTFYEIVNSLLWATFLISIFSILYKSHKKNSTYTADEKQNVITFVYYMGWFITYYIFERQFGMVMPLFITRHFDNNFFGMKIPVTNIMSIFQITIIVTSVLFFKIKIHDKIKNGQCLLLGFSTSLIGFLILYLGCIFNENYQLSILTTVTPIILFSLSDVFILNRIFSICRVAPKQIHAITTSIMMIGAACGFHGARIIAGIMAVDKNQIANKAYSMEIYKHGFLINSILSGGILLILILSYQNKKLNKMMNRIL
jgi:POT family proton-dependent oligopeptide transporter